MGISQITFFYHWLRKGVGIEAAEELKNTVIQRLEKCLEDSQTDLEFGDRISELFKKDREIRKGQIQSN